MVAQRLPRGRHNLTRDQVRADQRRRMLTAMADAMTRKGYAGTTVTDVIEGAGVSRETFYQQFSSKLACYLAAFDVAADIVVHTLRDGRARGGTPLEQFEHAVDRSIDLLAAEPAYARVVLVEVHAAGPEAMARHAALRSRIVDALADLLGATGDKDRFACTLLVAGTGALVSGPVVAGDGAALRSLRRPIVDLVRRALPDAT